MNPAPGRPKLDGVPSGGAGPGFRKATLGARETGRPGQAALRPARRAEGARP